VETSLTLLGQCKSLLRFWNYAFETLVYIINRMPTLVLDNRSPFDCLLQRSSDYDFLRTFECLCFSFLRPYHNNKLDFCSSQYVFVGYSSSHLGYHYLDIISQRIYISRHVYFHEQVFSFDKSEYIAQPTSPFPSNPTHLPSFLIYLLFHSPMLATSYDIVFSHPQHPTSFAFSLPNACFSNNYTAGTSPTPSNLHRNRYWFLSSPTVNSELSGSDASATSSAFRSAFIDGFDLVVDISYYPLQQHHHQSLTLIASPSVVSRHLMVLHPKLPKTANLIASFITYDNHTS